LARRPRNLVKAKKEIKGILQDTPLDIVNEFEDYILESGIWELTMPRVQGPAKGSRRIGSANMLLANSTIMEYFNLHNQGLTYDDKSEVSLQIFKSIIELLEDEKIIRQVPETIRETFTLIEGNNERTRNSDRS